MSKHFHTIECDEPTCTMAPHNQTTSLRTAAVFSSIAHERYRQECLKLEGRFKATCADPSLTFSEKLAILVEEVGEVARAGLNLTGLSTDMPGVEARDALKKELVQVAAICVAWLESLP